MTAPRLQPSLSDTARALAIGATGAGLAWSVSAPAAILLGPALLVSAASLSGVPLGLPRPVTELCFVILGLGIGAGFDTHAGDAILRWPLAFLVLLPMLAATLWLGRTVLERGFAFDRRSATLSAAPGHLSFVLGLAADTGGDVGRVAVVQSIRLLALTIAVPVIALAMGYRMDPAMLPASTPAPLPTLAVLALLGAGAGLLLRRTGAPAPMLLGPLSVSAVGHVTDLAPGAPPPWAITPAFIVLGTLIGTRFAGMTLAQLRAWLLAGLAVTAIAAGMAVLAALPVALALGFPPAHVVAAFSPGGLETMVALGAVMGASPGFVAACHMVRLGILTLLIPLSLNSHGRH
ncbi:AbrB family transcriptional regulator [Jhaorihella thermophila]|uniref:Ammonia monooxygenase n=1 Tax=Jhaorihella thermophila TaxID=488547 RepID=A0A1H5WUM3_9RHOB|nr:AbrB family transcriptional regulator [Jhaorihella thermophila]SEG03161.1 hypothetical protein SAMN05421751_10920 [Jhaorihella thermophila]